MIKNEIYYYYKKRKTMKFFSRVLILLSITFGALGGLTPYILMILSSSNFVVGNLFLFMSGILLAIERALNLSINHSRFVKTQLSLEYELMMFKLNIAQWMAATDKETSEDDRAKKGISLIAQFIDRVRDIEQGETDSWEKSNMKNIAINHKTIDQK